ncbi:hypothetical protein K0D42_004817 [Salmonella enterica subsp. enterica serovar Kentucky]|nr:hypothetical protein [Salmonella enterica]EBM7741419.1 hypothetical protein [Salmonella enterica subsp. enterica serovar Kentucky]EDU3539272.1 hypothetical protein [Salmonella enterica subsp. enterica serovar Mbandaka]EJB5731728.1 hypothetical protein [Salmonella enterica subsp. enterica serovar Bredeney]HCA3511771.1 hypothetical protein [Salmonella enterica subsp. enterica serovar Java]
MLRRLCQRGHPFATLCGSTNLVRAAPRHPANASRPAKKFRVPLTVPELVKQKIAGPRASGVGSDFVIDDGTGKTLGMVVGVTE